MPDIRTYPLTHGCVTVSDTAFRVTVDGIDIFTFPITCQVPTEHASDRDLFLSAPEITEEAGVLHAAWTAVSDAWVKKTYLLDVHEDGCYFRMELTGHSRPETIRYFVGPTGVPTNPAAPARPGCRYAAAGYALPEAANFDGPRMTRFINGDGNIAMGFMTPPPFVYPFWTVGTDIWVGVGLLALDGDYNFNRFQFKNDDGRCHFELPLEGRTAVDGTWTSEGIWIGTGVDAADTVRAYSAFHFVHGFCRIPETEQPRWWYGPCYCGWGDQIATGGKQLHVHHLDAACQSFYEQMSDRLDALDLHPTAIIIDDKWQGRYGELLPDPEKWPNLRAFTDAQHAKGRKVLLWVKVWNAEGLDADECMLLESQPYVADPTSPKYQKRLRDTVHKLLSPDEGCFNCDGFKLDFVNCVLMHPAIRPNDRSVFGIELVKRMLRLFYDAAKAAKPDALINNSCAHPYFAEVTDQVRMHDYRDSMRAMMPVMQYRQSIFSAAMPYALIDTDSSNRSDYREAKEYYLRAHELGIPDIYMITQTDEVAFTDEDWAQIREVWEDYTRRTDALFKK